MSELKTRLVLAAITVVGMIVVAAMNKVDTARGAALQPAPKVVVSSMPAANGTTARAVELSRRDASWSADGKQLVFARGSSLYVADGLGSEAYQVYRAIGLVSVPRFSADGDSIRFKVKDLQRNTTLLWEVSRDGANAHPLRGQ